MNERYTYGYQIGWNVENEYINNIKYILDDYNDQKSYLKALDNEKKIIENNINKLSSTKNNEEYKEEIQKLERNKNRYSANLYLMNDIKSEVRRNIYREKEKYALKLDEVKLQMEQVSLNHKRLISEGIEDYEQVKELAKQYDELFLDRKKLEHALQVLDGYLKEIEYTNEEKSIMLSGLNPQAKKIYNEKLKLRSKEQINDTSIESKEIKKETEKLSEEEYLIKLNNYNKILEIYKEKYNEFLDLEKKLYDKKISYENYKNSYNILLNMYKFVKGQYDEVYDYYSKLYNIPKVQSVEELKEKQQQKDIEENSSKKVEPEKPKRLPGMKNLYSTKIDEEINFRIQDMLDKYYGNKAKEKEYRSRYKRFISHLVKKDGYETIEDYEEKAEDEKFLQLEEYAYRLERLSKAENGSFAAYKKAIELYKLTNSYPKDENGNDLTEKQIIEALRIEDQEYIETNNYAYNQHKSTNENLKTSGKLGEKAAYLALKKIFKEDIDTGKKKLSVKALATNIIPALANAGIFIRNYTKRPLYSLLGQGLSKVHGVLYKSKTNVAGLYKSKRTHRYEARKDFYEQAFDAEFIRKNLDRIDKGKDPLNMGGLSYSLKKAFSPRLKAIFKPKEGNIAVLSRGANDIETSIRNREIIKLDQQRLNIELNNQREKQNQKIKDIKNRIKVSEDKNEKEKLIKHLKENQGILEQINDNIKLNKERPIPNIVQTDPISMAQHDKANKENMTKVITGVATAAKVVAARFLIPKVVEVVRNEIAPTQRIIPEQTIETEVFVKDGLTKSDLENITIGDVYDGKNNLSYTYWGGKTTTNPTEAYFRGIALRHEDKIISGSDSIGFDYLNDGITTTKISQMTSDTKLFDVAAETLTNAGNNVTSEQLISSIINSSDPKAAAKEFIDGLQLYIDSKPSGIPMGWGTTKDALTPVIENAASNGHFEIIKEIIPRSIVTTPGKIEEFSKINPRILATILALGGTQVTDIYDILRRTKSKEEMKKEGTYKHEVKTHQKENKVPYTDYLENKWGFTGYKNGDYESLYNEEKSQVGESKHGK